MMRLEALLGRELITGAMETLCGERTSLTQKKGVLLMDIPPLKSSGQASQAGYVESSSLTQDKSLQGNLP